MITGSRSGPTSELVFTVENDMDMDMDIEMGRGKVS